MFGGPSAPRRSLFRDLRLGQARASDLIVSTAALNPVDVSDEPATLSSASELMSLPTMSAAKLLTNSDWYCLEGPLVASPTAEASVTVSPDRVRVMLTDSVPPGLE